MSPVAIMAVGALAGVPAAIAVYMVYAPLGKAARTSAGLMAGGTAYALAVMGLAPHPRACLTLHDVWGAWAWLFLVTAAAWLAAAVIYGARG